MRKSKSLTLIILLIGAAIVTTLCRLFIVRQLIPSHRPLHILNAHNLESTNVEFSPDGKMLASAGQTSVITHGLQEADQSVKLWNTSTWTLLRTLHQPHHPDSLNAISFSPDSKLLATGSGYSDAAGNQRDVITVWNTTSGSIAHTLRLPSGSLFSGIKIALSPDGKSLATGDTRGLVKLWNTSTWQVRSMFALSGVIQSLSFSSDSKFIAAADWSHAVVIGRTSTGVIVRTIQQSYGSPSDGVTSVVFSPDGKTLATATNDANPIELWDTATGTQIGHLNGQPEVSAIAYSPDGRLLAGASWNGTIRLWKVATGEAVQVCEGHTAQLYSVAFSPDGNLLASTGRDGTVRIWGVAQ